MNSILQISIINNGFGQTNDQNKKIIQVTGKKVNLHYYNCNFPIIIHILIECLSWIGITPINVDVTPEVTNVLGIMSPAKHDQNPTNDKFIRQMSNFDKLDDENMK